MKIINVLKDDSFEEILELFRSAPEGEVFMVLPKNGKVFRREDHFAVFASEAKQGRKTVSLLTPNPDTAVFARKFGFTVVPTGAKGAKPSATVASAPPPADPDIRNENDDAFSDVPMTSDATMENDSTDDVKNDVDPVRNMHVLDEDGNPVDENEDGKRDEPAPEELTIPDTSSEYVGASDGDSFATLAAAGPEQPAEKAPELDYIDAMWRDKVGKTPVTSAGGGAKAPSFLSRTLSGTGRIAGSSAVSKKVAMGLLLVAFVVLGSVVYAISGSAKVLLTPVSKPVDTDITLQASDTFAAVDDAFLKLPGQLLEISKTETNTVPATGKRDVASKARGKIIVTNEFSSAPQGLVATTRFKAPDGQIFRTLSSINVPGSRVVSGKTVAGTISVDVVADKPGTEYNIPAGKFVIAAFEEKGDSEKVKQFYGVSEQPMSGGASGPSAVITQADYGSAQTAAADAVKAKIKEALESQGSTLMVLDGDSPVMGEPESSARVDDAAESVTATATGTLKTIGFKKDDLMELIRRTILKKDRLVVLPDQIELSYSDITFKPELGTMAFTVLVKGTGYEPVDADAIKADISGKNTEGIRTYFKDKAGIATASVTLSPFWVRKVPQKTDKIDVDLKYVPTTVEEN